MKEVILKNRRAVERKLPDPGKVFSDPDRKRKVIVDGN